MMKYAKSIYIVFLTLILAVTNVFAQNLVVNSADDIDVVSYQFDVNLMEKSNKVLTDNLRFTAEGISLENTGEPGVILSKPIAVELTDAEPFIAVGSIWKASEMSRGYFDLLIRASEDGRNWGEWYYAEIDDDVHKPAGEFPGVLLFFDKESRFIQYKIELRPTGKNRYSISGLNLSLISPDATPVNMQNNLKKHMPGEQRSDQMDFSKPDVVTRTEWGCPDGQGSRNNPRYTTVTHIIVHHSATENTADDWAAVVRTFWEWHTIDNGWGDIGYNYLVDPDGVVYEGRAGGENVRGAHFCGYNSGTMGICVIGTYSYVAPTDPALELLKQLLIWKCDFSNIKPDQKSFHSASNKTLNHITGHRVGCSTACPGDVLFSLLPSIREEVTARLYQTAPAVLSVTTESFTEFPAYKSLVIKFDASMNKESVEKALSISPQIDYQTSWNGGKEITVKPDALWNFSTEYSVKIDTSAKSVYGTSIDGDKDGIGGDPVLLTFKTTAPDTEPPSIKDGYPIGENISVYANMKYIFDEEIFSTITADNISISSGSGAPVNVDNVNVVTEKERTVVYFKPEKPLEYNEDYTVHLARGIEDYYGNSAEEIVVSFSTEQEQFEIGQIIDPFEYRSTWLPPATNEFSENINSGYTVFDLSQNQYLNGSSSGRLRYGFSGEKDGVVQLYNIAMPELKKPDSLVGMWIYGDYSHNELELWFNDDIYKVKAGTIDWLGWRFLSYPIKALPGTEKRFHSLVVKQTEEGEKSGTIYIEDLQYSTFDNNSIELMPLEYVVTQNYPNPFNPGTSIHYELPYAANVKIDIFNSLGQKITTLVNEPHEAGKFTIEWNAEGLASGMYIYVIKAGPLYEIKKMMLIK